MVGIIDSEWGIIVILVVVVLVFGGSQLPKLARSLGSAQAEFKKGLSEGKKNDAADAGGASGTSAATKDGDGGAAASG
ncbi:MAG TPA: twin-arginine translocase TatA/TatE family subunit [Acidimicrobiales bacterium]|nr:twin-arginine translocase TatA/TatE family subunit [Acidimicrobiales bacterium]